MATYKIRCGKCKDQWVIVSNRSRGFPICMKCQEKDLEGEIKDPVMKKMFDIPMEIYAKSMFLRDIKIKYLRYGDLSEKQIEAFKKTAKKLQEE